MEEHVYEDPDASLSTRIPVIVPRDYRENPVENKGEKSGVQQLSKERQGNTSKSLKKSKSKLRGRKNTDPVDSDKPQKEKSVCGDNQDSRLKKEKMSRSKTVRCNEYERNPKASRSRPRGYSDGAKYALSPALLGSMATMMAGPMAKIILEPGVKDPTHEVADKDSPPPDPTHEVADKDSPPPALPSRDYLLDKEFVVELKGIERYVTRADTELDEESDGYMSMDNIACCDVEEVLDSQTKVASPEQDTSKNRPYENLVANRSSDERGHLTHIPPEVDYLPPRASIGTSKSGDERHYENFGDEGTSKQEDPPPIPLRLYTKDAEDQYLHAAESQPHLPLLPGRSTIATLSDETPARPPMPVQREQAPPIPRRPCKDDKKGQLSRTGEGSQSRLPPLPERSPATAQDASLVAAKSCKSRHVAREAGHQLDLPPRHLSNTDEENLYDDVVHKEGPSTPPDPPSLPVRPYKNDGRGDLTNTPLLNEGQYVNFITVELQSSRISIAPPEQEGETRIPIPQRYHEKFTDAQVGSESYMPLIPKRNYSNRLDEGAYVNEEEITRGKYGDEPDEDAYMNEGETPRRKYSSNRPAEDGIPKRKHGNGPGGEGAYVNQGATPGYVNSGGVAENSPDDGLSYDYVRSDTFVRSIHGRAGRWAARPARK